MRALWTLGQGTVHQIRAQLWPQHPLAYTTVMTIVNRLERRGAAWHVKKGRSHLYKPVIAEQAIRNRVLEKLIDGFFDGSPGKLLEHLKDSLGEKGGNGSVSPGPGPKTPDSNGRPAAAPAEAIDPSLL
jgi:predicted transcriptional regulator